jgi:hypothetical protein
MKLFVEDQALGRLRYSKSLNFGFSCLKFSHYHSTIFRKRNGGVRFETNREEVTEDRENGKSLTTSYTQFILHQILFSW